MDKELQCMQEQANRISSVKLRRIEPKRQRRTLQQEDDAFLLLGLILVLSLDGGDKMLILMLLYIFAS